MINELGTKRFHIKKADREVGDSVIELTVGQYDKVCFDPKYLGEFIELLQEAKWHFDGMPKTSNILKRQDSGSISTSKIPYAPPGRFTNEDIL